MDKNLHRFYGEGNLRELVRSFLCPRPGHDDILAISLDDDVTLDDQALQARTLGREQGNQSQGRDPGWPKSLECFHVLTESLDEHTQARITLDVGRLEKPKDCVPLIVNQEIERDDQTLDKRGGLCGLHA